MQRNKERTDTATTRERSCAQVSRGSTDSQTRPLVQAAAGLWNAVARATDVGIAAAPVAAHEKEVRQHASEKEGDGAQDHGAQDHGSQEHRAQDGGAEARGPQDHGAAPHSATVARAADAGWLMVSS